MLQRLDNAAGMNDQSRVQFQQHLKMLWGQAIDDEVPVFVVTVTTRPQCIDLHNFRRGLDLIVHTGLPDCGARYQMWEDGIKALRNAITDKEIEELAAASEGFTGFDIDAMVTQAEDDLWLEVREATSFVSVSLIPFKQYHLLTNSMQVNYKGQSALEPAQSSSAVGSKPYEQLDPADQERTVYLPLKVSKLWELLQKGGFKTVTTAETDTHKAFQASLRLNTQ